MSEKLDSSYLIDYLNTRRKAILLTINRASIIMIKLILEDHKDGSLFTVVSSVQKTPVGNVVVSRFDELSFNEVSSSSVEDLLVKAFNANNDEDSVERVRYFFDELNHECDKLYKAKDFTVEDIDNAVKHLLLSDVVLNLTSALDSNLRVLTTFNQVESKDIRWFSTVPFEVRKTLGLMISLPEEKELHNLLRILSDSTDLTSSSNIRRMARATAIRIRQELNFVKVYNQNGGAENYEGPEVGFKEFEDWMRKRFH